MTGSTDPWIDCWSSISSLVMDWLGRIPPFSTSNGETKTSPFECAMLLCLKLKDLGDASPFIVEEDGISTVRSAVGGDGSIEVVGDSFSMVRESGI
jgi:hypothetical protein